jgi:very-short-patch-repair endonuclease
MIQQCVNCRKSFEWKRKRKCCSKECQLKWYREHWGPILRKGIKQGKRCCVYKAKCIYCKKFYLKRRSDGKEFCSPECYNNARKSVFKTITCGYCESELVVNQLSKQRFCNRKCFGDWYREVGLSQILQSRGRGKGPNSAEKKLLQLIKPLGFKYVGDWKFFIGKMNPDFVHKDLPLVIELFGEFWHPISDVSCKRYYFNKRGYKCLVVWSKQLNRSPERVVNRVKAFVYKAA